MTDDVCKGEEYRNRSNACYLHSDHDKAIEHYTRAIKECTNDTDRARAHYMRAYVYERLGNRVQAQVDFAKARQLRGT